MCWFEKARRIGTGERAAGMMHQSVGGWRGVRWWGIG